MLTDRCPGGRIDSIRLLASPQALLTWFASLPSSWPWWQTCLALEDVTANQFTVP
jgi:hypothetical protein